jgi:hypothetical protein
VLDLKFRSHSPGWLGRYVRDGNQTSLWHQPANVFGMPFTHRADSKDPNA